MDYVKNYEAYLYYIHFIFWLWLLSILTVYLFILCLKYVTEDFYSQSAGSTRLELEALIKYSDDIWLCH